jgi:hypothetical protein
MNTARLHSFPGVALALALVFATSGCATNRISSPDRWAHATQPERETVWSFLWGSVQQDVRPPNCPGPGLSEVTVKSNVGFALVSVLSLGIAMPVTIEWRCAKDKPTGGDNL